MRHKCTHAPNMPWVNQPCSGFGHGPWMSLNTNYKTPSDCKPTALSHTRCAGLAAVSVLRRAVGAAATC
jgi:hypothetical protein